MGGVAWLLLLVALGGAAAEAQDEAPSDAGAAERTEPQETAAQDATTDKGEQAPVAEAPPAQPVEAAPSEAKPSPEVFVPTEDISEDLSVRFPVDI